MLKLFLVVVFLSVSGIFAQNITYTNSLSLDANYFIRWSIVEGEIFLRLEVKTLGWVGFGIGEQTSGSMQGSDMLVGWISNGKTTITDRHTLVRATPVVDDCQDWVLLGGNETSDTTIIEAKRKLDTGDVQDRAIIPGPNRIVWAYGTSDTLAYHGSNRHPISVVFFGEDPDNVPINDTMTFDIFTGGILIDPIPTDYQCAVYKIPFVGDGQDYHAIEFEAIIDPTSSAHVHHFILSVCETDNITWFDPAFSVPQVCSAKRWNDTDCPAVAIWGWAPGVNRFVLPSVAGYRFGSSASASKLLHLQVHYDNPHQEANIRDNSTIRITYTPKLRQHDAGCVEIGDPAVTMPDLPPQSPFIHYEATCSSACTSHLPHNLTVFADILHMHGTGSQIYSTQWRNESFVKQVNRIDFWAFDLQQTTHHNDTTIVPGDRLNVHCIYNTMDRTNVTTFGLGTQNEMCLEFLYYYPKVTGFNWCGYYRLRDYNVVGSLCGKDFIMETNPVPDTVDLTPIQFANGTSSCSVNPTSTSTSASGTSGTSSGSVTSSTSGTSTGSNVNHMSTATNLRVLPTLIFIVGLVFIL